MIDCPKCSSEKLVETPVLGNIPLDVCPGCSGIWFDKGELEALLNQAQGGAAADLDLINEKPGSLACPRCKNTMARGGLVNPLLLVDKCRSCGGVWLDAHELGLAKKLLGLPAGPTEVKVDRPAAVPAGPAVQGGKLNPVTLVSVTGIVLGLAGISYELYLYFLPAAAVSHAPSAGVAVVSLLLAVGGIVGVNRD